MSRPPQRGGGKPRGGQGGSGGQGGGAKGGGAKSSGGGQGRPAGQGSRSGQGGRTDRGERGERGDRFERDDRGGDRGDRKGPAPKRDLGQQVEGRQAVRVLLTAGTRRVHDVWLSTEADALDELAALAERAGARVRRVPSDQIERRARTESPQGVVAFAAPVPTGDLDALLADPQAFLVALDGVTDPGNLGAVMRTAETVGATGIIVPTHRAVGLTPAVAKAAAGALEYLRSRS